MLIDFREWGIVRNTGRQRNVNERERTLVASPMYPTRNGIHNLGTCPDLESNLQSFGIEMVFQPRKPHWPGFNHS